MVIKEYEPWQLGLGVAILVVIAFFLTVISADHTTQSYYLATRNRDNLGVQTCVMGSVNWLGDDTIYCNADPNLVLDVLNKANASLLMRGK